MEPLSARRTRGHGWPPRLLDAVLLVGSVVFPASTLCFLLESHWTGPIIDFWSFLPLLDSFHRGEVVLGDYFSSHGGHRLLIPRLLYLTEYVFFDGRNTFLVCCGVLLQSVNATLLIRWIWKDRLVLSAPTARFLTAMTVMLLFSATQIENFARSWNVCWFVANSASIWSLFALVWADRALGSQRAAAARAWLALGIAAATVATYSMAQGLLTWPALVMVSAGLRLPWRWVLVLVVAGALAAGPFFLGYEARGMSSAALLQDPLSRVTFVALCLGGPLSWLHPVAGGVLGGAAMLGAAFLLACFVGRGPTLRSIESVYAGILALALGSAFMMAFGRMSFSAGIWAAPRYQAFVLLFWLSLISLATIRTTRRAATRSAPRVLVVTASLLWVAGVIAPAHWRQGEDIVDFAAEVRAANLAIVVGIWHLPAYRVVLSLVEKGKRENSATRYAPLLRERGLGMFTPNQTELLGMRVGEQLGISATASCAGEIDDIDVLIDRVGLLSLGAKLSGRAWVPEAGRSTLRGIVISDAAGTVIGLGVRGPTAAPLPSDAGSGWIAYTHPPERGGRVNLWARIDDRAVCRIGGPVTIWPGRT